MRQNNSGHKYCIFISLFLALAAVIHAAPDSQADNQRLRNVPAPDYDETGRKLPPGVPKYVDTNGTLASINHRFTTRAYQAEALKLLIQEANQAAKALNLPGEPPITQSNLVSFHVSPFGFAYAYKMIGNVTTEKYSYGVACDNKFNDLHVAHYDQTCLELKKRSTLPVKKFDPASVFYLATNWLSKLSMDVEGLNRDCIAHVAVSPFWNNLAALGETPEKHFVPIYYIWWTYPGDPIQGQGGAASVELYAPAKMLLQLSVSDPKYILRKPVEFTNMAALFPGTAPIHTNYPVKPVFIDGLNWGTSTN